MYKNSLRQQWDNLVSDFTVEHERMTAFQMNSGAIEDWYRQRIARFSSVARLEGMELDQLNRPEFAAELRGKLGDFRFQKKPSDSGFAPGPALGISAAVSVAAGVLVALLTDWLIVWPILSGIALFGVGAMLTFWKAEEARRQAAKRLLADYAGQLERHLPALMAVCDRHGID